MRCAVFGCDNNNSKNSATKWRFFHFPKDKTLLKKWVHFCRRTDEINIKNACICEVYFVPEDFERNLQFEMGNNSILIKIYFYKPNTCRFMFAESNQVAT